MGTTTHMHASLSIIAWAARFLKYWYQHLIINIVYWCVFVCMGSSQLTYGKGLLVGWVSNQFWCLTAGRPFIDSYCLLAIVFTNIYTCMDVWMYFVFEFLYNLLNRKIFLSKFEVLRHIIIESCLVEFNLIKLCEFKKTS